MQGDIKPPLYEEGTTCNVSEGSGGGGSGTGGGSGGGDGEASFTSVSNVSWRQGRQLLRQYVKSLFFFPRCSLKNNFYYLLNLIHYIKMRKEI